jgi:thymidine kinase
VTDPIANPFALDELAGPGGDHVRATTHSSGGSSREREGARSGQAGAIEVIVGGMFSGKTEELLRRLKRARFARQNVQAFKPRIDARYDASAIVSHDRQRGEALALASSEGVLREVHESTDVVGIDEAQFFDVGIVEVAEALANRGLRVILAGLDQDYLGRPFAPMPDLMAIAESVTKLHAVCVVCGKTASRSQRIVNEDEQVLVGGEDSYEPRCRACFEPRAVRATRVR